MLNTDEINKIRNYSNMGFSFTEVCMLTGRDPKTVRKYLLMEDFSPKKPTPIEEKEKLIKPSKLDPYKETIDRYLAEDEKMWFKQHHTSRQIWKRLMFEEGYTGGYSLVQRYVREKREEKKAKRTNLEPIREPGDAELDFGEAYFVDEETKEKLRKSFMVLKFPYSGKGFVQVFSGEAVECVCKGLMDIFEFICGVPRRIILDSSTGAGGIYNGNIYESEMFQRFQAHYHFKAVYHSVWHPQSKGSAERYIQTIRKTMFVPPQTISDIEAYNKSLLYKNKPDAIYVDDKPQVNTLYFEDFKSLYHFPEKKFDATTYKEVTADSYGRVCAEGRHIYTTRPEYASQKVQIGISAHFVDIYSFDGKIMVRHKREFGDEMTVSRDYSTTIDLLISRPAAWWSSGIRLGGDMTDAVRTYFDVKSVSERRHLLNHLRVLTSKYNLDIALAALDIALHDGKLDMDCAYHVADYIASKRLNKEADKASYIPLDGEISKKCPKHAIDLPREDGIIPNEPDKSHMGEKNILFIEKMPPERAARLSSEGTMS